MKRKGFQALTDEQRKAENIKFLNKPPRFPLYENPDGSIGKIIPIGKRGGYVKINDASLVSSFLESERKWNEQNEAFHHKLLGLNVKAYRCNDGWVDREKCRVTFFKDDDEIGWYWHTGCKVDDKIFIGNRCDGGRFAIITDIKYSPGMSYIYTFKPLPDTLDGETLNGEVRPYLTALTYHPTFWERIFKPVPELSSDICLTLD